MIGYAQWRLQNAFCKENIPISKFPEEREKINIPEKKNEYINNPQRFKDSELVKKEKKVILKPQRF